MFPIGLGLAVGSGKYLFKILQSRQVLKAPDFFWTITRGDEKGELLLSIISWSRRSRMYSSMMDILRQFKRCVLIFHGGISACCGNFCSIMLEHDSLWPGCKKTSSNSLKSFANCCFSSALRASAYDKSCSRGGNVSFVLMFVGWAGSFMGCLGSCVSVVWA